MAVTYLLISVALLCLAAAFLIGYYMGREKARQGIHSSLKGCVIVRPTKEDFNCPFYTPEGYSGGCIAPDPAQNKAWNGGSE